MHTTTKYSILALAAFAAACAPKRVNQDPILTNDDRVPDVSVQGAAVAAQNQQAVQQMAVVQIRLIRQIKRPVELLGDIRFNALKVAAVQPASVVVRAQVKVEILIKLLQFGHICRMSNHHAARGGVMHRWSIGQI